VVGLGLAIEYVLMAIAIAAMPIAIDLMNFRENIEGLRMPG
jgi:hypothetical protein